MDKHYHFFAVDLGATSGRTIVGSLSENKLKITELTRFKHPLIQMSGHYYWDIYFLYGEIIRGLKETVRQNIKIDSIGIDTWGVDFVLIGKDGQILRTPYSYRDPHTANAKEWYFNLVPQHRVYEISGMPSPIYLLGKWLPKEPSSQQAHLWMRKPETLARNC